MGKDILIILMIAFGLFAIIMFVLFYTYLRKYYNNKHLIQDYEKDIENESDEETEQVNSNEINFSELSDLDEGFVPIKKE